MARFHGQLEPLPQYPSRSRRRTPSGCSARCSTTTRTRWRRSTPRTRSTSPTRSPGLGPLPRQRVPPARLGLDRRAASIPFDGEDGRRARAAAGHRRAGRRGARADPAHRHDRLGQVDDARRDDRPHQRDASRGTSSRSRTRSSTCTATAARSSTSARSAWTPTSFERALRRVLRQDPDVILIGEMRDEETVRTALSAAETGHLVLSTVHTLDAAETVNRIIDFFQPHEQQPGARDARRHAQGRRLPAARADRRRPGRVAVCEILRMTGRVARHDHRPGPDRHACAR